MDTSRMPLQEIYTSLKMEYKQIQSNIELPEGIDHEWNMMLIKQNDKLKANLKELYDKMNAETLDESNLVSILHDIHQSFVEWYAMIKQQIFLKETKQLINENTDLEVAMSRVGEKNDHEKVKEDVDDKEEGEEGWFD